jgi:carboxymethylenebutenolidase
VPRDDDELLSQPGLEFGSGVIGVCDVCKKRQAVIVLQKERFKLCVLDFLNKTWTQKGLTPGAPLPLYRSDRVWFPTKTVPNGLAPAITLSPTKPIKHPSILITPDIYGLTTSVLDGAIRLAREGFEVMIPDIASTPGVGPQDHLTMRLGARFRGGVPVDAPKLRRVRSLYGDALRYLRGRELVDPDRSAVLGLSYGGTLALALAGEEPRLTAIAVAYPAPVRPAGYLRLLSAPVLFIGAGADSLSTRARAQFAALGAEVDVRFVDFPNAHHQFLARDLGAYDLASAEAAWGQLTAFMKERMMPPPPKPPAPPVKVATGTPPSTPIAAVSPGATPAGPPLAARSPVPVPPATPAA